MRNITSGVLAGVAGAMAMGATMVLGRRAGFLHQTLDQDSEDWLDRNFDARRHLGDAGTTAVEQGNHLAAGAAFGALYAQLPETRLPSVLAGALYGAGLYTVNIAVAAPVLGITEGEHKAPLAQALERFGLHVMFGVVTALGVDALRKQ